MRDSRKRNIWLKLRLTPEEYECLCDKMAIVGINNREAFIRKMALDGIIIKLDIPELKEMISLLRYTGNNVNQIAKSLHETGRAYETDISDIKKNQEKLIEKANSIIAKLTCDKRKV